jgi:hypothetical protein
MASATGANIDGALSETDSSNASYWKRMLRNYERRNASLEKRRSALVERVRFMECTLPSLLVGAAASAAYGKQHTHDKGTRRKAKNTVKATPAS